MPPCNPLATSNRLAPLTRIILSRPAPPSLIVATRNVRPPLSVPLKRYKNNLQYSYKSAYLLRHCRPFSALSLQEPRKMVLNDKEKLNDVQKLSPHVTRVLGQNPGMMTLQGTNSYILQPPSNPNAPLILIDTSSPHTAQQYVDCLLTHLHHLALEAGNREVHFESAYTAASFKTLGLADNPGLDEATKQEKAAERDRLKANVLGERMEDGRAAEIELAEYGPAAKWAPAATQERKLPVVEHIILTHRHLDHVGALPTLLSTLKEHGNPLPKIWKLPNPDEIQLASDERDRFTTDAALLANLPNGTYTPFSPFQPFHPVMPGLMISIIDPAYRHLLKHDKEGKPKWTDVPEIARVSVRCWKTPGHTQDSISLVLSEGDKGIFTGDTVLGSGTTIFTDLSAYMSSLKLLLAMKPSVLYPAHGPHIVGVDKAAAHVNEYIKHRQQREDQLLAVLKEISSAKGVLASKLRDYSAAILAERDAKVKYRAEFLSGKPYDPNASSKSAAVKLVDKGKAEADVPEQANDRDKEGSSPTGKGAAQEADPYAVFEDFTALTVPLLCRLVYQTEDEKKIWAAGKPTLAHLEKLFKEGKVRQIQTTMPKIIDFEVTPAEAQDAWEAVSSVA